MYYESIGFNWVLLYFVNTFDILILTFFAFGDRRPCVMLGMIANRDLETYDELLDPVMASKMNAVNVKYNYQSEFRNHDRTFLETNSISYSLYDSF